MSTVKVESLDDKSLDLAVKYCQLLGEIVKDRRDTRILKADHEKAVELLNDSDIAPLNDVAVYELLEKEAIAIFKMDLEWCATKSDEIGNWRRDLDGNLMMAMIDERDVVKGATPIIAIKRCYVMSVIGRSFVMPSLL